MKDINNRIIQKAQNGDVEALDYIIDYYANLAYFLARDIVKNESLVEDCANTMLDRLVCTLKHFDPKKSKFTTWLYIVFRSTAINFKNKELMYNNRIVLDDEIILSHVEEKYNDTTSDKLSKIEKLVGKENYEILLLKLGYEYKFSEIATIKNIHESKIKRIFYKTYKQVREYVEKKDEKKY